MLRLKELDPCKLRGDRTPTAPIVHSRNHVNLNIEFTLFTILEENEAPLATVDLAGATRKVALDLVPETRIGQYVIVHVGFAIQTMDEEAAR